MPGVKEATGEVEASCLQLRKAWRLTKDKSQAEWERWKKGKSADDIRDAEAAARTLVFEDGLGKLLESWHKSGDSYAKFHAHYLKIHKIQLRYHKLIKTALKDMTACKKVCTLLIVELDEQTRICADWLETIKLVWETDEDAAIKQSKDETEAVDKGKIVPPIALISLPVATVLRNAGLKPDQIDRIDMGGTLEVILSDKAIRAEFAQKDVDVSALAKLTNSAALGQISADLKAEALTLLEQMDDGKIDEDKAEAAFKVAVDAATDAAVRRAVQEAERITSIKQIAKYANVKSAFKVVALALGVGAAAAVSVGGALSVNPGTIALGLYSTYKALSKLSAELKRLNDDFDGTIDQMQKKIILLGQQHGALKESANASINELVGVTVRPTVNDLLELNGSAVDKLARQEAAVDQMSKRLDNMIKRSDTLAGKINKLQKAMEAADLDAKGQLPPLRKASDDLADQINLTIIDVEELNEKVEGMRLTLASVQSEVAELRGNLGTPALYAAIAVSTGLSAGVVAGVGAFAQMAGATAKVCSTVNTGISACNKAVAAAQTVTGYLKDKHNERAKTGLS